MHHICESVKTKRKAVQGVCANTCRVEEHLIDTTTTSNWDEQRLLNSSWSSESDIMIMISWHLHTHTSVHRDAETKQYILLHLGTVTDCIDSAIWEVKNPVSLSAWLSAIIAVLILTSGQHTNICCESHRQHCRSWQLQSEQMILQSRMPWRELGGSCLD